MFKVHPTAILKGDVQIGDDVEIGPFCVLTGPITLGEGVRLLGSNYLQGPLTIGSKTVLYPHACVGLEPQDIKFKPGDPTAGVAIGSNSILREHVTIHAATKVEVPTRLGDNCFMLANSHIGHDAVVGNFVTMINNSAIGGHAQIGDNVLVAGGAAVHQFCRVGRYALIGGMAGVTTDLPPFCAVVTVNRIGGINRVGLRRAGFPREHITAIVRAFMDILRDPKPRDVMVAELARRAVALNCPPLQEMSDFIAASKRGCTPGMGKAPRDAAAWFKKVGSLVVEPANADADDHEGV